MTLADIVAQAKALSVQERKELVKELIDTFDEPTASPESSKPYHWGENLIRLLDELGPIDLVYPEIEDPVEWVKQLRSDARRKRLGDWGDEA
jgi:hypothetical protein